MRLAETSYRAACTAQTQHMCCTPQHRHGVFYPVNVCWMALPLPPVRSRSPRRQMRERAAGENRDGETYWLLPLPSSNSVEFSFEAHNIARFPSLFRSPVLSFSHQISRIRSHICFVHLKLFPLVVVRLFIFPFLLGGGAM